MKMIAMRYTIVASVAGVSYAAYEDNHSQTLGLDGVAGMKLNLLKKRTGNDEIEDLYAQLLRDADVKLRMEATSQAQGGATASAAVDIDFNELLANADAALAAKAEQVQQRDDGEQIEPLTMVPDSDDDAVIEAQPLEVITGVPVLTDVPVVEGAARPANTDSVLGAARNSDGTVFGVRVEPTVQQPKKTEPEQTGDLLGRIFDYLKSWVWQTPEEVTSVGVESFPASPAPAIRSSIYERYMEELREKTPDEIDAKIDSSFTGKNLLRDFRAAEAAESLRDSDLDILSSYTNC